MEDKVNILPCCGGHEVHFDHCIVFEAHDDLELDDDNEPWAPAFL